MKYHVYNGRIIPVPETEAERDRFVAKFFEVLERIVFKENGVYKYRGVHQIVEIVNVSAINLGLDIQLFADDHEMLYLHCDIPSFLPLLLQEFRHQYRFQYKR